MKTYKKEKWFLGIGAFCVLGFVVSLTTNITYALFYLVAGAVLLFFSKDYLSFLMRKRNNTFTEEEREVLEQQEELAKDLASFQRVAPGFGVNEAQRRVAINNNFYDFASIIKCDLIEDESTVTKSKGEKKVALGKAFVGGMLLGPTGAIIGGQAGKTVTTSTTKGYCHKLAVKVTIRDFQNPTEYLSFINKRVSKSSRTYQDAFESAQKCLAVLDIILDED
jgi:hypothetical protein